MRRVLSLIVGVAAALGAPAPAARAATPARRTPAEVTSLSVVPASGRAEVVIAVDGTVNIQDFTLASPSRVVLDLKGARLVMPARMYDKVTRGGISNVRLAQYKDDVVRVVLDLDGEHEYTVTRGTDDIRIAIAGGPATFTAWHTTRPAVAAAVAAAAAEQSSARRSEPRAENRVVEPAPLPERIARVPAAPRITVTYNDADIRDVLAAFATFSGRTIVVGKGVTGNVTAEVKDQPWDVALRATCRARASPRRKRSRASSRWTRGRTSRRSARSSRS